MVNYIHSVDIYFAINKTVAFHKEGSCFAVLVFLTKQKSPKNFGL